MLMGSYLQWTFSQLKGRLWTNYKMKIQYATFTIIKQSDRLMIGLQTSITQLQKRMSCTYRINNIRRTKIKSLKILSREWKE